MRIDCQATDATADDLHAVPTISELYNKLLGSMATQCFGTVRLPLLLLLLL